MQIVAPHYCINCGKVGNNLCHCCKYDIVHDPHLVCILCNQPNNDGICQGHKSAISKAYFINQRQGFLQKLIDSLKFGRNYMAALTLAELLDMRLPIISRATLVPIPTAPAHIRQRGYDQALLIARHLAVIRQLPLVEALVRTKNTTQHLVGRSDRMFQADGLFNLSATAKIVPGGLYLIIDDIITSGATVLSAAKVISGAGGIVLVAAAAFQPPSNDVFSTTVARLPTGQGVV